MRASQLAPEWCHEQHLDRSILLRELEAGLLGDIGEDPIWILFCSHLSRLEMVPPVDNQRRIGGLVNYRNLAPHCEVVKELSQAATAWLPLLGLPISVVL